MLMFRWYLALLIVLVSVTSPSGMALAFLDDPNQEGLERNSKGKKGFTFVGYYEAIDPEDGAVGNLSIIYKRHGRNEGKGAHLRNAEKGYFQILSTSSAFTPFCGGQSGYTKGTAQLQDGILVSRDREFICNDNGTARVEDSNISPVVFIPNKKDDVLMMKFLSDDRGPIFFHRISSRSQSRGVYGLR